MKIIILYCILFASLFHDASAALPLGSAKVEVIMPKPGSTTEGYGLCNSGAFAQLPNNKSGFVGRALLNATYPENPCSWRSGTQDSDNLWKLVYFEYRALVDMTIVPPPPAQSYRYRGPAFVLQNDLTPKPQPFYTFTSSGPARFNTALDPTLTLINGETWMAFECYSPDIDEAASGCVAPLTFNPIGQVVGFDSSRASVAVRGQSNDLSATKLYKYSASVPKIFTYKGKTYLYWSALRIDADPNSNYWYDSGTRGMELVSDGTRLWGANSGNAAVRSVDDSKNVEVFGVNVNNPSLSRTADGFDTYVVNDILYLSVGIGGTNCVVPDSSVVGCYQTMVLKTTDPLGYRTFNNSYADTSALPSNTQNYGHYIKDPLTGLPSFVGLYLGGVNSSNPVDQGVWLTPSDPALLTFSNTAVSKTLGYVLTQGQTLKLGTSTLSIGSNGKLRLTSRTGDVFWESSVGDPCTGACRLSLNSDGNLVLYNGSRQYWSAETSGNNPTPGTKVTFSDQLPFVKVTDANDNILWSSSGAIFERGFALKTLQFIRFKEDNNLYFLIMQNDGHLVLYKDALYQNPQWGSGTSGLCSVNCLARFNNDGNFVIYNGSIGVFASNTQVFNGNSHIARRISFSYKSPFIKIDDGNQNILWALSRDYSPFTINAHKFLRYGVGDQAIYLVQQNDGNLVVYKGQGLGTPVWASYISGQCGDGCQLWFQPDGNLVSYGHPASGYVPLWASNTANRGGKYMRLNNSAPYISIINGSGGVIFP
jgi:hypothetical protein